MAKKNPGLPLQITVHIKYNNCCCLGGSKMLKYDGIEYHITELLRLAANFMANRLSNK